MNDADKALRSLATTIYYLLTFDDPDGVFHMNKSVVRKIYWSSINITMKKCDVQTMHVLHQGRAEYTLITPGNPPKVEKKVTNE